MQSTKRDGQIANHNKRWANERNVKETSFKIDYQSI